MQNYCNKVKEWSDAKELWWEDMATWPEEFIFLTENLKPTLIDTLSNILQRFWQLVIGIGTLILHYGRIYVMKPIYFDFLCGSLDFVFSIIKGQIYIDLLYRNKLSTKDLPICNENKVSKVIIEFHGSRIMYFSYRCTQ